MREVLSTRLIAVAVCLIYVFSINMTGTWGCEPGKLCGTWLGKHCCEHPDDHSTAIAAGKTVIEHEDHGCRFSPIPPNPRAAFIATTSPPTADFALTLTSPVGASDFATETAALIPDSRGPPGVGLRAFGSPGLRAPPLS